MSHQFEQRAQPPQIHPSNPSAPLTSMRNMSRYMGFMLKMPRRTYALERRPTEDACDWSVGTSRAESA
ncbi:hypothetical protein HBI17_205690 [Parastagonospora nodorum]|nr:hypothetical protein HBI10_077110 [Parastagonospora nodorum]KAH5734122.1 hypothetical protein HBI17_205690 [Parastagonospora nodorum]